MEELGAGEVVGGMVDVYSKVKEPVRVKFEPERINALLGTNVDEQTMLDYLAEVELEYDKENNEIVAPTFRHDFFRGGIAVSLPEPQEKGPVRKLHIGVAGESRLPVDPDLLITPQIFPQIDRGPLAQEEYVVPDMDAVIVSGAITVFHGAQPEAGWPSGFAL